MDIIKHPFFRPLIAIVLFLLTMQVLRSGLSHTEAGHGGLEGGEEGHTGRRLVVAHFMLGNTYPFTPQDWAETFDLAEDTGLDALALNLGPEEWQYTQALSAFSVLSSRSESRSGEPASAVSSSGARPLRLFLSLDMNVLPSSTAQDATLLRDKVATLLVNEGYLRWDPRRVLSTFGGHDASFGGVGWEGWLRDLSAVLGEEVFFWPAFFLPPKTILDMPHVDGAFAWNNAWPLDNRTIDLREDEPFLAHRKPYMAAVSPVFSTHYGREGEWAFNKNWIYRSDDLLYPTRWTQLLALPPHLAPPIIQVISWNDHGESHGIAPVLGAEPGSQAWTTGMGHEAFREMTRFFATVWRGKGEGLREAKPSEAGWNAVGDGGADDGLSKLSGGGEEATTALDRLAEQEGLRVWGWWRIHPKGTVTEDDPVGRPDHADWAQDLLNFVVLVSSSSPHLELHVHNGPKAYRHPLRSGFNMLVIQFVPGEVRFEVMRGKEVMLYGEGRRIEQRMERYNFNFWTGSWGGRGEGEGNGGSER